MLTSAETYAQELNAKKHVQMDFQKFESGDRYKIEATSTSRVDIGGFPAKIVLAQKTSSFTDLTPVETSVYVFFTRISSNDATGDLLDAQKRANAIYPELVGKYGQPTSAMVRFSNAHTAKRNYVDTEVEVRELSNQFYNDKFVYLHDISESWKYPSEYVA